jgi:hypothetical protein
MSFKKINPNKSYKTSELVNKINELNQALDKFVSAIDSRLSELDEKIENLEEERTLIKAPKIKLPECIAKKILPDGTLSGGIEANASSINVLENIIDDDDDYNEKQRFALYKLVKEYES